MDMTGEYTIAASRETVWQALNDPAVLKACIPGCEELEKDGDDSFKAKVKVKIGPVRARFSGAVTLSDQVPPESYVISGQGTGGPAGFAKGRADVRLAEDGENTVLAYDVKAEIGGKLAQVGSRLVNSSAKKIADEFFGNFQTHLGGAAG
jgi:carbon monoxide dehydrogenase subunit G